MPAVLILLVGAALTVAGSSVGWTSVGRPLFVAGLLVLAAGVDLARPDR